MQSFENNTPTKRLGFSLNIDTGYKKGKAREVSPPQTPKMDSYRASRAANIREANRAPKVRNGTRETFLDDITSIGPSKKMPEPERGRINRDSHDLSLSPRQGNRDSLVDHMLLSLDQFSFGNDIDGFGRRPTVEEERLYTTFGEEETYQPTSNFAPRNGRGIGGHNYSYSSDYDMPDDASRQSRGRRSNSSSNFQTSLGRINSKRDTSTFTGARGQAPQVSPRGVHSRSGKGSKGSSANSFDLGYAQVTGNQRWVHRLATRSSSFDYGSDRLAMNAPAAIATARQMDTTMPAFNPYNYDAAPTPTIPGGPRRVRPSLPIVIPQQPELLAMDPSLPKLERKRSTRSSKSGYKGKLSQQARYDYGLNDRNHELPPIPAFMKEAAPLVGHAKAKYALHPSPPPPPPAKEKQGFFRRVFGGSRNNPANIPEPPPSHGSATSGETTDSPSSKRQHNSSQIIPQPPLPREPPPAPKEHAHVLTKKPSYFFRRRKKSVTEPEPPIPVPMVTALCTRVERGGGDQLFPSPVFPSPVSSLRKVMNPYLKAPARSPVDVFSTDSIDQLLTENLETTSQSMRGFSPDYEPDPSATIRTVDDPDLKSLDASPTSYVMARNLTPTENPRASSGEIHSPGADATFLQDSSDNDRASLSEAGNKRQALPGNQHGRYRETTFRTPSPSVPRELITDHKHSQAKLSPNPRASREDEAKFSPQTNSPQIPARSRPSSKKTTLTPKAEDRVVLTPTKKESSSQLEDRVWLEPSSSEEDLIESNLPVLARSALVAGTGSVSTDTVYMSATSLPIVQIEAGDDIPQPQRLLLQATQATKSLDGQADKKEIAIPVEDDRLRAKKIYDGSEDFIQKERAAAWIGEDGFARSRTLAAYMELYDFTNLNILAALRAMCSRLVLKAESQQVDRILVAFAKRWCQCNSNHGFKAIDVVHTICYSILLLNTDLHMADIEQKMSRSQFVKNTMPTIRKSVADSTPDALDTSRPTILPGKSSTFELEVAKPSSSNSLKPASIEIERPSWRTSFKPPARIDFDGNQSTPLDYDTPIDDCGPLVKAPFNGSLRIWEVQVEIVLKDFYNTIRAERLPLFGSAPEKPHLQNPSSNNLSVFSNGMLRRSPSVLSKAPSEATSYTRGRTADTLRTGHGKWANKNRSRPRLYPGSGLGSSRTSLDDQSMWSPSVSSSTWSKYSLGKTHTSMSVDSLGSAWPQSDYQKSIGFANALSQAIIREETVGSPGSPGSPVSEREREELRVTPLLDDESLELAGAPWAKEGIVNHKHHLEALDKKAKDRNWAEVFAVVEKGYMSLFSFSSKSMRNKSKGKVTGGVVGGGNWQDNAESLGSFLLRQTIASALPSPGYSKTRPNVWALSLPTGAVHLFQVGTPEIVKEFVSAANYWSARLSTHPLVGGISNIEYGWSEAIVNNVLVTAINDSTRNDPARSSAGGRRPSLQSSLRSSFDHTYPGGTVRSRLPGDLIAVSDWSPPTQSMRASNSTEADQLRTLNDYVTGIEDELLRHNQLRSPMLLAFTPRHMNAQKAMANWEKKSSYLLREIIKFRTYIDSLQTAQASKIQVYADREAYKRQGQESDDEADVTLMG